MPCAPPREGGTAAAALSAAASAAEAGRESTIPMEAKVGRARYQAGKGAGHVDAGAASVCLLFQELARAAGDPRQDGSPERSRCEWRRGAPRRGGERVFMDSTMAGEAE